jgi:hypothetical protein
VETAGITTSIVSKSNLHMALCFSPVGDEGLSRRARQFPALVNSTFIDWLPKQALRNVAASFLKEVDFIPRSDKRECHWLHALRLRESEQGLWRDVAEGASLCLNHTWIFPWAL